MSVPVHTPQPGPSMITETLNEGTVTSISTAGNGGAKITVDANQGPELVWAAISALLPKTWASVSA